VPPSAADFGHHLDVVTVDYTPPFSVLTFPVYSYSWTLLIKCLLGYAWGPLWFIHLGKGVDSGLGGAARFRFQFRDFGFRILSFWFRVSGLGLLTFNAPTSSAPSKNDPQQRCLRNPNSRPSGKTPAGGFLTFLFLLAFRKLNINEDFGSQNFAFFSDMPAFPVPWKGRRWRPWRCRPRRRAARGCPWLSAAAAPPPDHTVFEELHTVTGVPRERKMLKGHLPRVLYHQVHS